MQAKQQQSGFALLIFVLMMMAIGGVALTGYAQNTLKQVEEQKFQHNKEVLERAKQALLMYAYKYPSISPGNGPGRLPCPDIDDDGDAENPLNCSSGGPLVGRLPWDQVGLNIEDIKDSSNTRLWYAVSSTFSRNKSAPIKINSDSLGTISILGTNGDLIYDGSSDSGGVVAVIIAPGAAIIRSDGFIQTRIRKGEPDPSDERLEEKNYLDSAYGEDNASFLFGDRNSSNGVGDGDGFILGPVYDPSQNAYIVNDQMVVITAEEVIAMAEKATLQAYRDAIDEYQQNIWGTTVANYRYPWLDDYSTTTLVEYDADINTVTGRVPSIFGRYFDNSNPLNTQPIISERILKFDFDSMVWSETIPASIIPDIYFDTTGDLQPSSNYNFSYTLYFWDGHTDVSKEDPNSPYDGVWELCTGNVSSSTGNQEDNCNRKADGTFKTLSDPDLGLSDVWLTVKRLIVTFNSSGNPINFIYSDLKSPAFSFAPPSLTEHAYIYGDYNNDSNFLTISANDYDLDYKNTFNVQGSGPTAFGVADKISVGLRYYPELPRWALATNNDWHDSIQMAVTQDYQPDGGGNCNVSGCFTVDNMGGSNSNKASLLVIAGQHDLIDDLLDGYANDWGDIFEPENIDFDFTYDGRAGNDTVLVLQEQ